MVIWIRISMQTGLLETSLWTQLLIEVPSELIRVDILIHIHDAVKPNPIIIIFYYGAIPTRYCHYLHTEHSNTQFSLHRHEIFEVYRAMQSTTDNNRLKLLISFDIKIVALGTWPSTRKRSATLRIFSCVFLWNVHNISFSRLWRMFQHSLNKIRKLFRGEKERKETSLEREDAQHSDQHKIIMKRIYVQRRIQTIKCFKFLSIKVHKHQAAQLKMLTHTKRAKLTWFVCFLKWMPLITTHHKWTTHRSVMAFA